ncbi:hypothetical protein N7492_004524 [Penicillium capsulatum]|uniref:NAA35-like N-terminal domain-containing protein n=1 Tax=Penicillium capsulatum TaxID=69766 RepID=A0A9W9IAF0_9EURO|nr:hypothetical protein N7492_004524 [Penicillium capsulatum]
MDSGYIAPGENHAQALEDDYDVRQSLTPEEVVGLMDQLLSHEVLPKTIEDARFDRVPADFPLVSLVLRAYSLALIKACDFVHARVVVEYYYEEEDFVGQLYNRNLLSAFDPSHFYRLLDQAVAWVDAQKEMDEKLRDALRCRLLFRRSFLSALDQDLEVIETRSTEDFASSLSHLVTLSETTGLGKLVPAAFSMKIQRKLASTVPPRPIVHIDYENAIAHAKRICQDAIDMQQMLDYRGPSNFKVHS